VQRHREEEQDLIDGAARVHVGPPKPGDDPHFLPVTAFLSQASAGTLPAVSFVDPNFGLFGVRFENDEHPPVDIQRGQAFVSRVLNAVRNGPNWQDSIVFITYDEHGGFYDHAKPPRARQGHALEPDGIAPAQCADLSNPLLGSTQPGGGANCTASRSDALQLCPDFTPTGAYPAACANFDQLGVRVPFLAISPFSKRAYVSHTVGDHTSLLALIEKRFLSSSTKNSHDEDEDNDGSDEEIPHLTKRDQHAATLEDLFDFDHSPSLQTTIGVAQPPAVDCTPQ